MARASRSVLLVVVAACFVLVPTGASASVDDKPLPKDACDLVDVAALDAALGVPTDPPTAEPTTKPGSVGCVVPIPYDPSTCIVQPAPGVHVAVGKGTAADRATLKQIPVLAAQQGFEVRPLKGKKFGRKGAFLVKGLAVTFYGGKGSYLIQVEAADQCGSASMEQVAGATQVVAAGVVRQI